MQNTHTGASISQYLTDHSVNGIAIGLRALIHSGYLKVGDKLPPIRDLAYEMSVSPATISAAWKLLQRQRILSGDGRKGTWVSGQQSTMVPTRFALSGHFSPSTLNLSLAVPDSLLLPDLSQALAHGANVDQLNSYTRAPILPELESAVRKFWPYDGEAFLATNGGYSAIHTILHALSMGSCKIAIENPTALRHLDILEDLGAIIIPVECDTDGPTPDSLADALKLKPAAFLFQPRLNSVTGQTTTKERIAQLAAVLRNSNTIVIEDDGLSKLSSYASHSIGSFLPDQTLHVHSFSKTLGPDLRMAVVSGPKNLIESIRNYRSFSSGWTSRILQSATAWLLNDSKTQDDLVATRTIYNARRANLISALRNNDVHAEDGEGLCAWIKVADERYAMITLASHGISVGGGERFTVRPMGRIRVATGILPQDQVIEVARIIALSASDPTILL